MKKYAIIGTSLLLVICLVFIGITFHIRNTFFDISKIIYSDLNNSGDSKKANLLTEKTGIVFDENIILHKELIDKYDNIVFCEMTDLIERKSEQEKIIVCYVESQVTEEAFINFILIDGLSKVKGNYIIAYQIEWKNTSSKLLPKLALENMLWDIDNQKSNYLFCYYEESDCWLEKKLTPASIMSSGYYPQNLTSFDLGANAENTMIQIWGSIIPTEDYSNNRKLAQIRLKLCSRISEKEKHEYTIEWWDMDSNS